VKAAYNFRAFDADEVRAAIDKARAHAESKETPITISRVALNLGVTTDELNIILDELERKTGDEQAQAICRTIKMARQEARADIEDRINERKSQPAGPIFLAKVNHNMIETTKADVTMHGVRFSNEDILD
jgi:DNA-binding transcriptional MerR regulator